MTRRPAFARPLALLLLLVSASSAPIHLFWPYGLFVLGAAVLLAVTSRNAWQCQACGAFTERE